jgi:hypothetical protein
MDFDRSKPPFPLPSFSRRWLLVLDARRLALRSCISTIVHEAMPFFFNLVLLFMTSMDDIFSWLGFALLVVVLIAMLWDDRLRMLRPSLKVEAEVIGHRAGMSDGHTDYAAVYRFTADGVQHDVVDNMYSTVKRPPVATITTLHYPQGRPDLARRPRPAYWTIIYVILSTTVLGLLVKLSGSSF